MSFDFEKVHRSYEIYKVKNDSSSGRPVATLIPHERVLQYNRSNPIFFKNISNNNPQTFYAANANSIRANNLYCTCGLMANQESNKLKCTCKRSYSMNNVKNANLPHFHESCNCNEKYNYYSNFSTPV